MCLAVPAQLISINDAIGTVELTGERAIVVCFLCQMQRWGTGC